MERDSEAAMYSMSKVGEEFLCLSFQIGVTHYAKEGNSVVQPKVFERGPAK